MPVGRITRIIGGFYYINDDEGRTITGVPRGKLRAEGLLVGDLVEFQLVPPDQGVIESVYRRQNYLKRPLVSNITQVGLVFAHKNPDFNYLLIDRFLVMLEAYNLRTLLLFNKSDLVDEKTAEENAEPYRKIGYGVLCTSTKNLVGKDPLLLALRDQTTALTGPSGVGKSALINLVAPDLAQETGAVSAKIGRGRHTTREVRLLPLPEGKGFILDTPGFTQLELDFIPLAKLSTCFPEFDRFEADCRFQGCLHQQEPDCGVKKAVTDGQIYAWRYEHYSTFLAELKKRANWKYQRTRDNSKQRS